MTHSEILAKLTELENVLIQPTGLKRDTTIQVLRDIMDIKTKIWADVLPEDAIVAVDSKGRRC